MKPTTKIVVAWHNQEQISRFLNEWGVPLTGGLPDWLVLQQDTHREGCAVTKNKGVAKAMERGAEIVVVLDDDCFPDLNQPAVCARTLPQLAEEHEEALQPQPFDMVLPVTSPPSRGTPYHERTVKLSVAASMGFWTGVGDYDAPGQLVHGAEHPMDFHRRTIAFRYFSLCGMNLAFRPADWLPWCSFIDVPRFDDIWMGWLWMREAYRRGYCFNLAGPLVRHSRQSNVWRNLVDEAKHLERNETLWRDIATHPAADYASLRKLLPV